MLLSNTVNVSTELSIRLKIELLFAHKVSWLALRKKGGLLSQIFANGNTKQYYMWFQLSVSTYTQF